MNITNQNTNAYKALSKVSTRLVMDEIASLKPKKLLRNSVFNVYFQDHRKANRSYKAYKACKSKSRNITTYKGLIPVNTVIKPAAT